jgi:hypothetical protein
MPRAPRRQLSSAFRAAVRNDSRGIVKLAHLLGLTSYTALSRLLYTRRISGTPLNHERLRQLATTVNYTGEVYRD